LLVLAGVTMLILDPRYYELLSQPVAIPCRGPGEL
jgi:hypothetical protein